VYFPIAQLEVTSDRSFSTFEGKQDKFAPVAEELP